MKVKKIYSVILSIILVSCSGKPREESVYVKFVPSVDPLVKIVSSVDIIPLETDNIHIIGSQKDLIVSNDSYIISDASNGNIFRYSLDGKFLNKIGNSGRGPEDYLHINNVQLVDSLLYVFSNPSKVLSFRLDGTFVSSKVYQNDFFGDMSYWTKDGIVTYYGFDSIHDHRVGLINDDKVEYYLPSHEKVVHYSPLYPIYSSRRDTVFFIDSYNSTIWSFFNKKVSPYCTLDFGKYNIPSKFFKFSNAEESVAFLMGQEFAMISSFLSDEKSHLIELIVQKKPYPEAFYGFEKDGDWFWFSVGRLGEDVLANSFKALIDGNLYCLLDPIIIDSFPETLLDRVKDRSVLSQVDKESNYVLAILHLNLDFV